MLVKHSYDAHRLQLHWSETPAPVKLPKCEKQAVLREELGLARADHCTRLCVVQEGTVDHEWSQRLFESVDTRKALVTPHADASAHAKPEPPLKVDQQRLLVLLELAHFIIYLYSITNRRKVVQSLPPTSSGSKRVF